MTDTPSQGEAWTAGPWAWFGDKHDLYLATTHSGRRYVMGFQRMGMRSAQPVFQVAQRMIPAAQLVTFEVGDQSVRGFAEAALNSSVYRTTVSGIDAADARLIAAAPCLAAALAKIAENDADGLEMLTPQAMQHIALAALARAKGEQA